MTRQASIINSVTKQMTKREREGEKERERERGDKNSAITLPNTLTLHESQSHYRKGHTAHRR